MSPISHFRVFIPQYPWNCFLAIPWYATVAPLKIVKTSLPLSLPSLILPSLSSSPCPSLPFPSPCLLSSLLLSHPSLFSPPFLSLLTFLSSLSQPCISKLNLPVEDHPGGADQGGAFQEMHLSHVCCLSEPDGFSFCAASIVSCSQSYSYIWWKLQRSPVLNNFYFLLLLILSFQLLIPLPVTQNSYFNSYLISFLSESSLAQYSSWVPKLYYLLTATYDLLLGLSFLRFVPLVDSTRMAAVRLWSQLAGSPFFEDTDTCIRFFQWR